MARTRHRRWLYNRRPELAGATVGADRYGYAYDSIGNRLWSAANLTTNTYAANSLNQYTLVGRAVPSAPGSALVYDADGNLTNDGIFSYSYDAENRLIAAYPISSVVGALAVENRYDHRHRRIQKVVKSFDGEGAVVTQLPPRNRGRRLRLSHVQVAQRGERQRRRPLRDNRIPRKKWGHWRP